MTLFFLFVLLVRQPTRPAVEGDFPTPVPVGTSKNDVAVKTTRATAATTSTSVVAVDTLNPIASDTSRGALLARIAELEARVAELGAQLASNTDDDAALKTLAWQTQGRRLLRPLR